MAVGYVGHHADLYHVGGEEQRASRLAEAFHVVSVRLLSFFAIAQALGTDSHFNLLIVNRTANIRADDDARNDDHRWDGHRLLDDSLGYRTRHAGCGGRTTRLQVFEHHGGCG